MFVLTFILLRLLLMTAVLVVATIPPTYETRPAVTRRRPNQPPSMYG